MNEREKSKIIENADWLTVNKLISREAKAELEQLLCGNSGRPEQLPELMTSREVMAYLNITKSGLQSYFKRGKLERVKISHKKIMIPRESIMNLVKGL